MTLRPLERIRVAMWAHHFRGDLLRQARSVCASAHEAEDAVQEVMLKAVQKHDTLRDRPDAVVQAYLRAALLNHLRSAWRHQGRVSLTVITEDMDVPAPAPEDPLPFTDEDVAAAIDGLPSRMREALELRLQGYSYKHIAKVMDVKVGTVGAWLAEARVRLRDDLMDAETLDERGDSDMREDSQ
jgi:RNA polymerase sigma factor (sigma-70 family)